MKNFLSSIAIILTWAHFFSPASADEIPPRAIEGSQITLEQLNVLANLTGCPPDNKTTFDCVKKKYNLHPRHIKYPGFKLTKIYNNYVDYLVSGPQLYELPIVLIDGNKRLKVSTTYLPGTAVCPKSVDVTFSFDVNKSNRQPIDDSDMSQFIRASLHQSLAESGCITISKVHLIFDRDGEEFARETYDGNRDLRNPRNIKVFSNIAAEDLVAALYQKAPKSESETRTANMLRKLSAESNIVIAGSDMEAVLTGEFDNISGNGDVSRATVMFDIVYSFFQIVNKEVSSSTVDICYPNGTVPFDWTQTSVQVDAYGNPTSASTSLSFRAYTDPQMVPVYKTFEADLGGRSNSVYHGTRAVIDLYGCNSDIYKTLYANVIYLGKMASRGM